jgi:hypothetical protein
VSDVTVRVQRMVLHLSRTENRRNEDRNAIILLYNQLPE